jgi:hypothetical protein
MQGCLPRRRARVPGQRQTKPANCCSLQELEAMHRNQPEAFRDAVRDLTCCYAYSARLRHRCRASRFAPRRRATDCQSSRTDPVTRATRSNRAAVPTTAAVRTCCTSAVTSIFARRGVGPNEDDIYVNRRKVAAGHDRNVQSSVRAGPVRIRSRMSEEEEFPADLRRASRFAILRRLF